MKPEAAGEPRRSENPSIPIIEIIGLPGAGKTLASVALVDRLEGAERSWISDRATQLRRSFAPKVVLPVTFVRYRRVIRALRPKKRVPWARLRDVGTLLRWRGGRLWRARDPVVSSVFVLSVTVTEIALARLEAMLRRRTLVTDEGFVHRTLAVWIRAKPANREATLSAYIETIPVGSRCILLRCSPEVARARALTRARGIPTAMRRAARVLERKGMGGADPVDTVYSEQAKVFDSEALRNRVDIREVDADGTPEEIAEKIEGCLNDFGVGRRQLIFLRLTPDVPSKRRSRQAPETS